MDHERVLCGLLHGCCADGGRGRAGSVSPNYPHEGTGRNMQETRELGGPRQW